MYFTYVGNQRNVSSFKVHNEFLAHNDEEDDLFLNGEMIEKKNISYFFFENSFCFTKDGKTVLINLLTKDVDIIDIYFNGNLYFENTFLTSFDSKREENFVWSSKYAMYQLKPFSKLYELPNRYIGSGFRHRNYLYRFDNESRKVTSLSLLTGKYLWKIGLSNLHKIANFQRVVELIGIIGDSLWITFGGDHQYGLSALNIHNGHVIPTNFETLPIDGYGVKKIEDRGNIFSLSGVYNRSNPLSYYAEIEGEAGKILRSGTTKSLFDKQLMISDWLYNSNKIYFTARKDMLTATHVGVLDYETLELLWHSDVPDRKGDLKDLQVSKNKLFVLDTAGTLHIFEEANGTNTQPVADKVLLKEDLPNLSRFKSDVHNRDVSHIPFFTDYPSPICSIEVFGDYPPTILTLLTAIETLTEEKINILEYKYQEADNELTLRYLILGTELVIDTRLRGFGIPRSILEDVNGVLRAHQSAKRIKEFEPMPPDDGIILTYVDEETYHQYGRAGFGAWEEYKWDSGEKEWIGVW